MTSSRSGHGAGSRDMPGRPRLDKRHHATLRSWFSPRRTRWLLIRLGDETAVGLRGHDRLLGVAEYGGSGQYLQGCRVAVGRQGQRLHERLLYRRWWVLLGGPLLLGAGR